MLIADVGLMVRVIGLRVSKIRTRNNDVLMWLRKFNGDKSLKFGLNF